MSEKTIEVVQDSTAMDLQIISNVHKFEWNFNEIKAAVQEHIDKYVGLVVTEDNLKDMESAQKELAGVRNKIDGFRKKVKKLMEEPYKNFENQIKELQQLVEKAETPLKEQILKYEDQRIKQRETELLEFAKKTAGNLGLRDEYFKISIQSKWTNRTARDTTVKKEIVTEIEALLEQQRSDDEAAELQRQKTELITGLCLSTSGVFGLKTPITPEDIAHLTHDAGLADIPGIINAECQKRAELEQAAAAPEQAPHVFAPVPPPVTNIEPPIPRTTPISHGMPPMPPVPPTRVQIPPTPPTVAPELWDVDLHISEITVAKAETLKAYMAQNDIKYSFSGYKRRG